MLQIGRWQFPLYVSASGHRSTLYPRAIKRSVYVEVSQLPPVNFPVTNSTADCTAVNNPRAEGSFPGDLLALWVRAQPQSLDTRPGSPLCSKITYTTNHLTNQAFCQNK